MSDLCSPTFADLAGRLGFSCQTAGGLLEVRNPLQLENWTLPVLEWTIIVGSVLGKHLPDGFIKIGAAVLFFLFGVWLLLEGIFPDSSAGIVGGGVVLAVSVMGALARMIWKRSRATDTDTDTHLVDDNRTPID